jgi:hypothetical protein
MPTKREADPLAGTQLAASHWFRVFESVSQSAVHFLPAWLNSAHWIPPFDFFSCLGLLGSNLDRVLGDRRRVLGAGRQCQP